MQSFEWFTGAKSYQKSVKNSSFHSIVHFMRHVKNRNGTHLSYTHVHKQKCISHIWSYLYSLLCLLYLDHGPRLAERKVTSFMKHLGYQWGLQMLSSSRSGFTYFSAQYRTVVYSRRGSLLFLKRKSRLTNQNHLWTSLFICPGQIGVELGCKVWKFPCLVTVTTHWFI